MLDAKLNALEGEGDDKRFEDAREELSSRLAEVHTRLSDMDAESGPARAAALLAGTLRLYKYRYITSYIVYRSRIRRSRPAEAHKIFQWRLEVSPHIGIQYFVPDMNYYASRMRLALARALFVKVRRSYQVLQTISLKGPL